MPEPLRLASQIRHSGSSLTACPQSALKSRYRRRVRQVPQSMTFNFSLVSQVQQAVLRSGTRREAVKLQEDHQEYIRIMDGVKNERTQREKPRITSARECIVADLLHDIIIKEPIPGVAWIEDLTDEAFLDWFQSALNEALVDRGHWVSNSVKKRKPHPRHGRLGWF